MFLRLFLLFTIVPLTELWLLIRVGEIIGASSTLLLVMVTGAVGAYLARQQGIAIIGEFQRKVDGGQMPTDALVEGILVLIGGVLLVTPGIMTDFVGFSLVIPFSRKAIRETLKRFLTNRIIMVNYRPYQPPPPGNAGTESPKQRNSGSDNDIIDV